MRVLLSGGIGSGKSAVSRALESRGIVVLDADRAGHEVLEPGGEAFDSVVSRWPEVLVDGRIDRRALGRVVFGNPDTLAELETYTHPAIRARLDRSVASLDSREVVVEMPLPKDFMGPGWLRVVVDSPDAVRIQRLRDRGMDSDEIESRMASQPTRQEWRDIADYVVDNSGDRADLDAEVSALLEWMRSEVAPHATSSKRDVRRR